jgi:CHASE2 domain-containing sensor protein
MSNDLVGALWVAFWGAVDASCTFMLASDGQFGAAAIVAVLGILTLSTFVHRALTEI